MKGFLCFFQSALSQSQLQQVTTLTNDIINMKYPVYRGQASLATVKAAEGVRAIFDEAYGDQVTVVSVGAPVPEALEGSAAVQYPVELCAGMLVCI